jgi:hypothetical protein
VIIDILSAKLVSSHAQLTDRLQFAQARHRRSGSRSTLTRDTDAFLATTSQHLAAVIEVIVPAAQEQGRDGSRDARHFLRECRRLEKALVLAKGKLYGSANSAHIPWARVWRHVAATFDRVLDAEQRMIDRLAADVAPAHQELLVSRWTDAEPKAPTRPHPYLPHCGASGRIARRIWARADRAWDYAEGRVLPVPEALEPAAITRPTPLPHTEPLTPKLSA